jgi:rhamnosyltransferase
VRIAAVVHGYPPHESAGVELVAKEQADALAARGHALAVFARTLDPARADGATSDEIVDGIAVRRVVCNHAAHASFRDFYDHHLLDDAFRAFLREHRPDVVHAQHLVLLSPNLLAVARAEGAAVVVALHDAFYACHRLFLLDRDGQRCAGPDQGARCVACLADVARPADARHRFDFMARALYRAEALTAPSPSLRRRYVDALPFLAGRITLVDPGIVARPVQPAASAQRTGPVRLVFIGTWLPHKGLDLLVEALRALDAQRYVLRVYGEGVSGGEDYVAALRARSADRPIEWCGRFVAADLPAVLGAADVLVLPSRCDESYSRVVREARAAGLAVVAPASGGPADVLRDEVDALLVEPASLPSLQAALGRLVDDPALLERLRGAPAVWPTVADGAVRLETVLADAVARRRARQAGQGRDVPRVSVAYVTKNGATWLDASLRAVRRQRGAFELLEILAVDSGSTDGTLDVLAHHDVRTIRIAPEEFGHGTTRNLAAAAARGDVVVFLTQDAAPANDDWLAPLVDALQSDPLLAGVWSRHAPRDDCHPMEWRNLVEFPLFRPEHPRIAAARGNPDYVDHPERYYWFSNNSSAFRREVLLRWPFPAVAFAEDQAWARLVLEAGWRTALVPESLILHSHAYSAWTNLQRNFDHAHAMRNDLGQSHGLTLGASLRAAGRETRRDVAFWAELRRRTQLRVALRWGARAFAYHLAAFGGQWLGMRAARLPDALMGRLSLQQRLRAGS